MKEKILIIEDDPTIQAQLKNLLAGNGYEVEAVTDFTNPVEQFRAFAPHLVLLDIKLPGNSGFDICSQIRTFSDLPIIFVTSSNTDMDELNSIMLGGDAFITKPYNPAILLAKIASLLRKAGASSQAAEVLTWNGAELHLENSTIAYGGKAAELIHAGRVQLNHRECVKPDHAVAQGDVLSCRGLGKCVLTEVGGPSKKGRILIVLERYV